ncbi:MAG: TerC family protein [Planctomycetes bacterium]|nr:TerC family protein [Planctomycetota bacterium]
MTADQAAGAVLAFRPRIVYPYHYRGPEKSGWQDPQQFKVRIETGGAGGEGGGGDGAGIDVRLRPWYDEWSETSPWFWVAFAALVAAVMFIDLGVFHRAAHKVRTREAMAWVSVWVTLALLFNLGVWRWKGGLAAIEFLTGYLVELGLSVDNIFVFIVVFSYFSVRPEHQHRVLFWGILGAVVMRMLFIFVGITFLQLFGWVIYIFGLFLVYTGVKLFGHDPEVHPEKNWVLRLARRLLPVTDGYRGDKFFAREGSPPRVFVTPLFLVLLVVEATDVVFAVDSVPAILGVTQDRFIAYTSNIFAILGLRAMYFVLVGILDKFHYLKYGLSLVLVFIGAKMLLHSWVDRWFEDKIHAALFSLAVVVGLLGGSIVLSLLVPPKRRPLEPEAEASAEAAGKP